jgi:hypothetical protein
VQKTPLSNSLYWLPLLAKKPAKEEQATSSQKAKKLENKMN